MSIIILPTQLFGGFPLFREFPKHKRLLIEHPEYFTKFKYHKMKLILHRASMKRFAAEHDCEYIEFHEDYWKKIVFPCVMYDPVDYNVCKEFQDHVEFRETPAFICKISELKKYYSDREDKNQRNHIFYKYFRKKFGILKGMKDTYDHLNRNPFPNNYPGDSLKEVKIPVDALNYVKKNFSDNPGGYNLYLPYDRKGAKRRLKEFIQNRLGDFGPYEDGVRMDIVVGTHSYLSALINIGLLSPVECMKAALKSRVKIQSREGYIRQLFWREYMRYCHVFFHKKLVSGNYFQAHNKISKTWFTGKTPFPIANHMIQKVKKYAYLHHIERLMYVGNIFLLTHVNPKDVYRWFMCLFIDVAQWVMEPNIYGMSQFSAGPLIMSRHYICSSNYITKMSDFSKDELIDELYREFVKTHQRSNYSHW